MPRTYDHGFSDIVTNDTTADDETASTAATRPFPFERNPSINLPCIGQYRFIISPCLQDTTVLVAALPALVEKKATF